MAYLYSRRPFTYVTGSGTDELLLFVLLDGLPKPAGRSAQGEQSEWSPTWQSGSARQGNQT